jgi:alpha-amylase/alpha-mannosidase (GH57 family)
VAVFLQKKANNITMGLKAICVHGHFYQPPREDPLSGLIPDELGAEPYHNWNERIHQECYKPNARAGNFEKISFNIGPTLFQWIQSFDPETYYQIIEQEQTNYQRFGVGNAIAQAYNHVILPLANKRDKITQIKWGIADFEHRFKHKPSGMWLPETAVDMDTLCLLADNDIKFTMLAPWQVEGSENLKTDQPYLVKLPGARKPLIIFLYNRELSTSVSFLSEATRNADFFAEQWLLPMHKNNGSSDHMTLIASDGELYGHHKAFRDMFLSHFLNGALHKHDFEITYPGRWLLDHEPTDYIDIIEYTSWSCHHGVMRWMGECGCTNNATWKAPLRWGLEKLSEELDESFDSFMGQFTPRKWQLRNDYIHVFLGDMDLKSLLRKYIKESLSVDEIKKIGMILAAQYERQRMFTSCGWFFDSFHRIEPQNNIAYAAQATWLTEQVTGKHIKSKALALLRKVRDQRTGLRGDTVFTERYQRTLDFTEENLSYFNESSNLST